MRGCFTTLLSVVLVLVGMPASAQITKDVTFCATVVPDAKRWRSTPPERVGAPDVQVAQLLVYVNFNQVGGTVVRAGFDNAETLTSSLVSGTRTFPPPSLTTNQKAEVIRLVEDDFSPFNIKITADQTEFLNFDRARKHMALISTSPTVGGFPNGTAGVSPFTGARITNSMVFVFSAALGNDPVEVASTISHEIGHSLAGLPHQHLYNNDTDCQLLQEYHPTIGTGPLAFSPLMGVASGSFTNWWAQPCIEPTFGVPYNDFVSINNEVVLRPDDFPDGAIGEPVSTKTVKGILGTANDIDFVRFNFKSRRGITVTSDNIDLKVIVYNGLGVPLGEFDDPNGKNVTIPATSRARFISVQAGPSPNVAREFLRGTYVVNF